MSDYYLDIIWDQYLDGMAEDYDKRNANSDVEKIIETNNKKQDEEIKIDDLPW